MWCRHTTKEHTITYAGRKRQLVDAGEVRKLFYHLSFHRLPSHESAYMKLHQLFTWQTSKEPQWTCWTEKMVMGSWCELLLTRSTLFHPWTALRLLCSSPQLSPKPPTNHFLTCFSGDCPAVMHRWPPIICINSPTVHNRGRLFMAFGLWDLLV